MSYLGNSDLMGSKSQSEQAWKDQRAFQVGDDLEILGVYWGD